ncbi:hypothetical protein V1509DRAFT_650078 [Lipomyces kononenkoae]
MSSVGAECETNFSLVTTADETGTMALATYGMSFVEFDLTPSAVSTISKGARPRMHKPPLDVCIASLAVALLSTWTFFLDLSGIR